MAASSLKSKRERCCSEDQHYQQYPRAKSRDRQHVLCARFAVVIAMFSVIALVTVICVLAHQAQSRMIEAPGGSQLDLQDTHRNYMVSIPEHFSGTDHCQSSPLFYSKDHESCTPFWRSSKLILSYFASSTQGVPEFQENDRSSWQCVDRREKESSTDNGAPTTLGRGKSQRMPHRRDEEGPREMYAKQRGSFAVHQR